MSLCCRRGRRRGGRRSRGCESCCIFHTPSILGHAPPSSSFQSSPLPPPVVLSFPSLTLLFRQKSRHGHASMLQQLRTHGRRLGEAVHDGRPALQVSWCPATRAEFHGSCRDRVDRLDKLRYAERDTTKLRHDIVSLERPQYKAYIRRTTGKDSQPYGPAADI